jgi:hypothetical protein
MTKGRNWPWLWLLATLAGCSQASTGPLEKLTPPDTKANVALIGPGRSFALPSPADLGRSVETIQMLVVRYDGQTFAFEGRLSITPDSLILVGLDGMGRRAITVTWNGRDTVMETAPWLPATFRPTGILSDIVVLYWPEAIVRRALATAGCDLVAMAKTRRVRCGNDEVLRARYDWPAGGKWVGTLHYSNLAWGYEVEVQSQELAK